MNRRDYFRTLGAATASLALRPANAAGDSKGRFRAAINAYSFREQFAAKTMTYPKLIRMASDLGVDVDMTIYWLPDTSDATLIPLRKLAYQSGVSIYSIGIATGARATPELRALETEEIRKWLEVAEKLGASHIRAFGGGAPKGATPEQAIAWSVETAKPAADEAAKKGIMLGIEDDGGITTTAQQTLEIVKKVDSPWFGVNIDVGNFRDDAYTQIAMCAPFATNVHFKPTVSDNKERKPADIPRILKILGDAGYRGHLALEYRSAAASDPLVAVPAIINQLLDAIKAA